MSSRRRGSSLHLFSFGRGALALLMLAAAASAASAQAPDPVAELIRKADVKEPDNGFCAAVDWPLGTRESYVNWLRGAVVGSAKVNRFSNGEHCQFDRVTQVYAGASGRCLRYTWWACATGKGCARGDDAECLQANGDWQRQ